MSERICLPVFHFSLLVISVVLVLAWGLYQMLNVMNNNRDWSLRSILESVMLTRSSTDSGRPMGPRHSMDFDPHTMDDLYVAEVPPARRDYRKLTDPLKAPSRRHVEYPSNLPAIPAGGINIPTRGYYPSYQMVGYVTSQDNPDHTLKLFGRRTDKYKWEYYVTHHSDRNLKMPISVERGEELMGGEDISVPGYGDKFSVNIYDMEGPRYLPQYY